MKREKSTTLQAPAHQFHAFSDVYVHVRNTARSRTWSRHSDSLIVSETVSRAVNAAEVDT